MPRRAGCWRVFETARTMASKTKKPSAPSTRISCASCTQVNVPSSNLSLLFLSSLNRTCLCRFVITGSDGVEHELMPGGRDRIVTFESRFEFCNLVEAKRLHEFDKQTAAIARGLEEVLPMRLLQLFSWSQLETLVAGSPRVDLTMWKANTNSSVPPKVLSLFWQVMETLTPEEHAGFIRFAWGRYDKQELGSSFNAMPDFASLTAFWSCFAGRAFQAPSGSARRCR